MVVHANPTRKPAIPTATWTKLTSLRARRKAVIIYNPSQAGRLALSCEVAPANATDGMTMGAGGTYTEDKMRSTDKDIWFYHTKGSNVTDLEITEME